MGWRIGDVIIGAIILLLAVTGFSQFFIDADNALGLNSQVTTDLISGVNELDDVSTLSEDYSSSVDESSDFASGIVAEGFIDARAQDTSGIANFFTKNIGVKFFSEVGEKLAIPGIVTASFFAVLGTVITILFIRSFWGDGRT